MVSASFSSSSLFCVVANIDVCGIASLAWSNTFPFADGFVRSDKGRLLHMHGNDLERKEIFW
jgi:hypothetical protein